MTMSMKKKKADMKSENSSSKRMRMPANDVIMDRISNLPEPLISRILDLLPTEDAVATGVLSSRWKSLWTSITSLNFDEKTLCSRPNRKGFIMKKAKFSAFVYRLLFYITRPHSIHSFRLDCTHLLFDPIHLNMWITLIAPTVCELDLCFSRMHEKSMEFHVNHFCFNKLVVLKLQGPIFFNVPSSKPSVSFPNLQILHLSRIKLAIANNSSLSFPNLKIMHLESAGYGNQNSVQKLLSSCHVLDDLVLDVKGWNSVPSLVICIPSLTRLNIAFWSCSDDRRVYEIDIGKLDKLKFLSISGHAFKAIVNSSANISLNLPDLKRLDLAVSDCREWRVMIKSFLEIMDNLEHLVLRGERCSCSKRFWWIDTLEVPKCLMFGVTSISFEHTMDDCRDELQLVERLLRKAEVLKVMKLGTQSYTSDRKLKLMDKISKFIKGSKTCKVEFT